MAAALQALLPKLGLSKKALLLGAGFVTKPTVQILSDAGVDVTVGISQHSLGHRRIALTLYQPVVRWNPLNRLLLASPMPILSLLMSPTQMP